MPAKVVELPRVAKPNIEDVLQQFLDDSAPSCKPPKSDRKRVIELFTICMNGYGHDSLSPEETKFFEKYYNMDGAKHKEFCEIFGLDKIGENVSNFVDYFLVRKVMESATFLKKAGTTMTALCQWLQSKGYLEGEEAAVATKSSSNAAKNLPKAEKAGRLLWEQAQATFGMFGSNESEKLMTSAKSKTEKKIEQPPKVKTGRKTIYPDEVIRVISFLMYQDPSMTSTGLLPLLNQRYPGKYGNKQWATLARQIKKWRALHPEYQRFYPKCQRKYADRKTTGKIA